MKFPSFLFLFFLHSYSHAQTNLTKTFFYGLPIDKNKAEVVTAIKADSSLFQIVRRVLDYGGGKFRVDSNPDIVNVLVRKNIENLPKPFKYPHLQINKTLFFTDTVLTKSYNTISIMLTYKDKSGSFKNAKKAFSTLIKTIEKEYKIKSDTDMFVGKNKTTFLDNINDDFRCSVEIAYNRVLKNHELDKTKCVIYLTYRLNGN